MKRAGNGIQRTRSPASTRQPVTRVTRIAEQLRKDAVKPDQYPVDGRVRSVLTDEHHKHDRRDEPDIIDWCVQARAAALLSLLLERWGRPSVYFQDGDAYVLEAAIAAALAGGTKHIAVVHCFHPAQADSFGSPKLVDALVAAAAQCESLTLERFGLLTPDEVHRFLERAREGGCVLQCLTLNQVAGMDREAMELLARLLPTSVIQELQLGEVDPVVLIDFLAALSRCTQGRFLALQTLGFSYSVVGEAAGRYSELGRLQVDEIEWQIALLKSLHDSRCKTLAVNAKRSVVVSDDGTSGHATDPLPPDYVCAGTTQMLTPPPSLPGTPPHALLELEGHRENVPRTCIEWHPRVVGRNGFLVDLAEGLNRRWLAEECLPAVVKRNRSMTVTEKDISGRIAFYLSDGDPVTLCWIRALNTDHRQLWDHTYNRHLEAIAQESKTTLEEIDALLRAGLTMDLIGYVRQLRERDQLPLPSAMDALRSRYIDHPVRKETWLWAFDPVGAIKYLIQEGRAGELKGWSTALRKMGALPPFEDLAPLITHCLDQKQEQPELVELLCNFQP